MSALLIAVNAYLSACTIVRPQYQNYLKGSSMVFVQQTPASAELQEAKLAVERALAHKKCEDATNRLIDETEKR